MTSYRAKSEARRLKKQQVIGRIIARQLPRQNGAITPRRQYQHICQAHMRWALQSQMEERRN